MKLTDALVVIERARNGDAFIATCQAGDTIRTIRRQTASDVEAAAKGELPGFDVRVVRLYSEEFYTFESAAEHQQQMRDEALAQQFIEERYRDIFRAMLAEADPPKRKAQDEDRPLGLMRWLVILILAVGYLAAVFAFAPPGGWR